MNDLTTRQLQVLETLEEIGGEATTEDIAKKIGATINGTAQILGALVDKEYVTCWSGVNKNAKWELTWFIEAEILTKWAKRILEHPFWLQELRSETTYERVQDDHDGRKEGRLRVSFTRDGDAWVSSDFFPRSMRFRMPGGGGGMSPRVRAALMILAYAIDLDNKSYPQK